MSVLALIASACFACCAMVSSLFGTADAAGWATASGAWLCAAILARRDDL